jgi:hypothetical protein
VQHHHYLQFSYSGLFQGCEIGHQHTVLALGQRGSQLSDSGLFPHSDIAPHDMAIILLP